MSDYTDDDVLKLAKEIKEKRGISLTAAMVEAEGRLQPDPEVQVNFTITINVKPRVAGWIMSEFGGHPEFSVEERLGAYIETVLPRARIKAIRDAEEGEDVREGRAVTLRRDQFARKVVTE